MAGVISTQSPPPAPLLNSNINSKITYFNNSYNNSSNTSSNNTTTNNNLSNSNYNNSVSYANVSSSGIGASSSLNLNNMMYQYGGISAVNNEHNHHHPHNQNQNHNYHHSVPSLRIKTNELFYRWFSESERSEQLREVMNFIKTTNKIPKLNDLQSFKNVSKNFSLRLEENKQCLYLN
jgi:hypothetical protein